MMVDAGVVIAEILLDLHAMRSQYREATDNLQQAVTFIKSAYANDLYDYDGDNVQHIIALIVQRKPNTTLHQHQQHFDRTLKEHHHHPQHDLVANATAVPEPNPRPIERRQSDELVGASTTTTIFRSLVENLSSSSPSSRSASPPSLRTKPPPSLITTTASVTFIDYLAPLKDNYENRIASVADETPSSSSASPLPAAATETWLASSSTGRSNIDRRIAESQAVDEASPNVAKGNASSNSFDLTNGSYANERRNSDATGEAIGDASPTNISGITDALKPETNSNSNSLPDVTPTTNNSTTSTAAFHNSTALPAFHHEHHYSYAEKLLKIAHIFHFVSIAILGVFVVQVCLKFGGMGCEFFKKKIEIFDAVIVLTSFGLDLAFMEGVTQTQGEEAIALLIIFLLWRILRVINGIMVTTKKRQEFRIQLQKRARRRAEKKIEYLEDDKNWKDREITNLKRLCTEKGALEEEIVGCKPRRRTIFQKMDTSMGLSSIASLSLGLSMSMTGTAGGAIMMRNFGAAGPFVRGGGPNHSAAARRLGLPTFRTNCVPHSPNQRRHGGQPTTPTSGEKPTTPEVVPESATAVTNVGVTSECTSMTTTQRRPSEPVHSGTDHVGVGIELIGRQERCPTFDGPDVIIIHESRMPSIGNVVVGKQCDPMPSPVSNCIPFIVSDSFVSGSTAAMSPHRPTPNQPPQPEQDEDRLVLGPQCVLAPPTISICSPTSGDSSDNDDVIDDDDDDDSDVVDVFSCSSSEESLSRVLSGTQLSVEPRSYHAHNGGPSLPQRQGQLQGQRRTGRGYSHVVSSSSSSSYLDQRSRRFVRRCFGGRTLKGIWGVQGNGRAASMSERHLTEQEHNATWDKRASLTY